jgi:hypothetical protein
MFREAMRDVKPTACALAYRDQAQAAGQSAFTAADRAMVLVESLGDLRR